MVPWIRSANPDVALALPPNRAGVLDHQPKLGGTSTVGFVGEDAGGIIPEEVLADRGSFTTSAHLGQRSPVKHARAEVVEPRAIPNGFEFLFPHIPKWVRSFAGCDATGKDAPIFINERGLPRQRTLPGILLVRFDASMK